MYQTNNNNWNKRLLVRFTYSFDWFIRFLYTRIYITTLSPRLRIIDDGVIYAFISLYCYYKTWISISDHTASIVVPLFHISRSFYKHRHVQTHISIYFAASSYYWLHIVTISYHIIHIYFYKSSLSPCLTTFISHLYRHLISKYAYKISFPRL